MSYFEIYKDKKGEWRWRFKAANHKIIATSSEGYSTKQACRHSIDLIKRDGPDARVDELD